MRILIFRLVFLLAVFPVYWAIPQEIEDPAIVAKRRQIDQRIDKGDYMAFADAASMPADQAIPFLWWYANQASRPDRNAALAAFKKLQGADQYFANRLAETSLRGGIDGEAFMIAAAVATPEVAAAIAPYLFDFTEIPAQGDMLGSVTALSAALALNRMYLPDAAVRRDPKFSYRLTPDDVVAWQKWAVAKGFVPKEWNARVGQGEVLKQWQESERREYIQSHPTPEPTATPLAISTPTPEPLSTPIPATPVPAISAIPTLPPASETPLWPWVAGILVISALLVTALKRR